MEHNQGVSLVLKELAELIKDCHGMIVKKESLKELITFLEKIKEVLEGLENFQAESAALIALRNSVRVCQAMVNRHKCKRRLYRIVWLRTLNKEVLEVVRDLENSLVQIQVSGFPFSENSRSMLKDLVSRRKQTSYEVANGEDEMRKMLDLDVNSLIMKFSRDLGINFERDGDLLAREVRYFKVDVNTEGMSELETMVDDVLSALACEDSAVMMPQEDEAIPSFDAFECPLTKQIMKDPVVLESEQTYERIAIEEWFRTCRELNKEPTCPITGQVLTTTELHSNLVLKKTIEEWYQRNVDFRVLCIVHRLTALDPMKDVDVALDDVLRLLNENSTNKLKIKSANLIPKLAKIWSLNGAAYFRSKALAVLDKMAVDDDDNQRIIVKEGFLKFCVRSLGSKEDEEKGNAIRLLYHLSSSSQEVCEHLGKEKGALIHLTGLLACKDQDFSTLADKTLKNIERVESNVLEMAEAGRLQPLLTRLCEGPLQTQIKMAAYLAKKMLVKSQVMLVAQTAATTLFGMLTTTAEAQETSVGALLMISSLSDAAKTLVDAGVLAPLLDIMFSIHSSVNTRALRLKETAAEVVSKLVAVPGIWEDATIDAQGSTLQSEFVVHNVLGLMAHAKPEWKPALLQILIGLASSPSAGAETCEHIRSGYGIRACTGFLAETAEASHRLLALKLLAVASPHIGAEMVKEFREGENFGRLLALLQNSKNSDERAAAACVLGNIPLTEKEVAQFFSAKLAGWTLDTLVDIKERKRGRSYTRLTSETVDGLLGILLHFLRCSPPPPPELRHHDVMTILLNQLDTQGEVPIKVKAALGIKYLSDKASGLSKKPKPASRSWLCFRPHPIRVCPIHLGLCDPAESTCLIQKKALVPVLELLEEEDERVQLAAVDVLSTLFTDAVNLRGAVEELARVDGLEKIVDVFCSQQPKGELQYRTVWIVERILREEDFAKSFSVDTKLFKALVEGFKYGSPATKALSQEALTNLKQLSGVSGGTRRRK